MKRREQSQTEQLRRALSEREAQLQEAQARLAALEGSTSLQVGRALTAAAKKPGRGLVRLPGDLFRLWRRAGGTVQATGRRRPDPVRSYETERQEVRLLSGTIGVRDDRLAVAGVLSPEIAADVDPYLRVVPLRPQDAQPVFESVDVDAVLVSASAALPGVGSSWAHAGDPAAADRTRVLAWVLEAAAARGVPTVLIVDAPAPPALLNLGFDTVHHGDAGVPLHRFNPIAADGERAEGPVRAPSPWPLGPVAGRLADRIGAAEAAVGWEELPALLRGATTAVVADEAAADRALVCGARALVLGGSGAADARGTGVPADVGALRSDAAERELARLQEAGPLSPAEVRSVLRSVFFTDAVPVRLAEVFAGLEAAAGADMPLAGRRAAVLAEPFDDTEALALADDVLSQTHPPAEVVVARSAEPFTGVQRLRSFGMAVRVADVPAEAPLARRRAALAAAATAPWSLLWSGALGPGGADRLADLVCAAECSGADAVGEAAGGAGGAHAFTGALAPELVRTRLVERGLDPQTWNRHGARLLALGVAP